MNNNRCKLCDETFHHLWEIGAHLVDKHGKTPGYGEKRPLWTLVYPENGRFAVCACDYHTQEVELGDIDGLRSLLEEMAKHTIRTNFDCLRKHVCSEALASL